MSTGKETLKGLKEMSIVVEKMTQEVDEAASYCNYNLRNLIESDVKEELETINIKVLTVDENNKNSGIPYLYIHVPVLIMYSGLYNFYILIQLKHRVSRLKRYDVEPGESKYYYEDIIIWEGQGYSEAREDLEHIRIRVGVEIEEFIRDYKEMNLTK